MFGATLIVTAMVSSAIISGYMWHLTAGEFKKWEKENYFSKGAM